MYQVTDDSGKEFNITISDDHFTIGGKRVVWDKVKIADGKFHILSNHRSYTATILKADKKNKSFQIRVNHSVFNLQVKDRFDQLLQQMGMGKKIYSQSSLVKAPMPGMVLKIIASEGSEVKRGDSLLILEAMKMENVIKAAADGTVKSILVKEKAPVEKNQVMIEMS